LLGGGKQHAKFSPGHVYFLGYPQFNIKEAKDAKKCVEVCPKKILKLDGKKLKVTDATSCTLCKACEDACQDAIKVEGSKEDFIITIESWGQLSVKEMLTKAIEIFDEELDELEEGLKELK